MEQGKLLAPGALVGTLLCSASAVLADTTDVKWRDTVTIAKEGAHCVDDPNCFNRYHPAIPLSLIHISEPTRPY